MVIFGLTLFRNLVSDVGSTINGPIKMDGDMLGDDYIEIFQKNGDKLTEDYMSLLAETYGNYSHGHAKKNYLLQHFYFGKTNSICYIVCRVESHHLSSLSAELIFLFCISGSVALKEMYEVYSAPHLKFYVKQLENVGQWLLIAVVGLTSIPIFTLRENCLTIYPWQYQAAAVIIIVSICMHKLSVPSF